MASGGGIRVGRAFGAPVLLKPSWFVIAVVVTLAFAPSVRRSVPGIGIGAFGVGFSFAVLLLVSVLVHELAHAAMAKAVDSPADAVVLDVWGGHTSFSVESSSPARSFAVAAVGPASNAVIAGLALLALPAMQTGGVPRLLTVATLQANVFVAAFNSLPGLPLDGGRAGIRNAKVVITGNSLNEPRVVTTGSFGYFTFDALATGETYVVTVNSQRYTFSTPSRVVSLFDNIVDMDFVADPVE